VLFALTANGSFSVVVESGGTLEVLDGDGAPSTAGDRSSVGSLTPERRFTLIFEAGSNVLVRASEVRDFGYSAVVPGMRVQSSNVTFEGAALGAYAFLKVESASPRFVGTTFDGGGQGSNYFEASGSVIEDCTFTGHLVAIAALQGSSLTLEGAVFRDLVFAVAANGSLVSVANSSIINSSQGLYFTNGSNGTFTDVEFGAAPVAFGDNASTLYVYRAFRALVLNQGLDPVRGAAVEFLDALGTTVAAGSTSNAGLFGPVALLVYNESPLGQTLSANYTLRASRALNSTETNFSAATESPQLTVFLDTNLDPVITLIRPAPGSVLLAGVLAVFEVAVSDPDFTAGGLTVTWRDSALGLMGTGDQVVLSFPEGTRTISVEVEDTDNGFRALSFVVEVVPGAVEVFTDGSSPAQASFAVLKTGKGAFLLTRATQSATPLLAVGGPWEVRPSTGTVVWANGSVTLVYDADWLPYGVDPTALAMARYNGTGWSVVPGSVHSLAAGTVRAQVTPAGGLGRFVIVALRADAVAPEIAEVPRLVAVRDTPFSYPVDARDTPGQALTFSLGGAPTWIRIDPETGVLAGVPGANERGLVDFTVNVTDPTGLVSSVIVECFVTATAENTPPRLVNPVLVPAKPQGGQTVTVQVTYFDAQDDPPVVLELLVDGEPHLMEPLDPRDVFVLDGKVYVVRITVSPGAHDLLFRTTDGAPGNADVLLPGPPLEAGVDPVVAVNNVFLALFLSVALTLVFIVYLAATRRDLDPPKQPVTPEPEDAVVFLEGPTLGPIEPQPVGKAPAPKSKEDALEQEAEREAERVSRIAGEVDEDLGPHDDA
jgi:hypothetical protein